MSNLENDRRMEQVREEVDELEGKRLEYECLDLQLEMFNPDGSARTQDDLRAELTHAWWELEKFFYGDRE